MYVSIEARDAAHADQIAESIGIYFNGCDDGRDCSCCGDRWLPKTIYWGNGKPDYKTMREVEKTYEDQGVESWGRKDTWASVGGSYAVVYRLNGYKIVYIKDR